VIPIRSGPTAPSSADYAEFVFAAAHDEQAFTLCGLREATISKWYSVESGISVIR
jgi:hypothetical protein